MSTPVDEVCSKVKASSWSPDEVRRLGAKLPHDLDSVHLADFLTASLDSGMKGLTTDKKVQVLKNAIEAQPDQETIKSLIATIEQPSGRVRDNLWYIVVFTFAFVLVGSFVTLAIGVFKVLPSGGVKPELVLSLFTSGVGFLAGLFVPSPIRSDGGQ